MNKFVRFALEMTLTLCVAAGFAGCSRRPATPEPVPPSAADAARNPAGGVGNGKLLNASYYSVLQDSALKAFVKAKADPVVQKDCAGCHGADLKGRRGVPNLVDEEWLWGTGSDEDTDETKVIQIQQTLLFGIRNQDCPDSSQKQHYGGCPDTRYSAMPAWGKVGIFTPAQIDDLTEYTLSLSGQKVDKAAAARGKKNWQAVRGMPWAGRQGLCTIRGPGPYRPVVAVWRRSAIGARRHIQRFGGSLPAMGAKTGRCDHQGARRLYLCKKHGELLIWPASPVARALQCRDVSCDFRIALAGMGFVCSSCRRQVTEG